MHTIFLDGDRYESPRALHSAIKDMLALPDYYGHNADALCDCLRGRKEKLRVVVSGMGRGDVQRALRACLCVFEDAGAEVERVFDPFLGQA